MQKLTVIFFVGLFLFVILGCDGACYTTNVYPDGHVRYYCSHVDSEMDCDSLKDYTGPAWQGEDTTIDGFVEGKCCKETRYGNTYTIVGDSCN